MRRTKKILVAPLNWGLGHAARCIPIIRELQIQGAEVLLASDGRALGLLVQEFPGLAFLQLPGYGISYRSESMALNLVRGMPELARAVYQENRTVEKYIEKHQVSGVISDNRLGCFSKKVLSVFISHQIDLIAPNPFLEKAGRWINYRFINKFNECWVPDVAEEPSLSGRLSHVNSIKNLKYIGALSRMENAVLEKKYDAIAVLSGPEPQRTKLEKVILEQAKGLPYRFLIVQGRPEQSEHFFIGENIEVTSFLGAGALNKAILSSGLYIGRTGYSSLMDLAKLQKPALLIPTPGQTEQEYLGNRLSANGIFHIQAQKTLDLEKGIPAALAKGGLDGRYFDEEKMKFAISQFLESVRGKLCV